MGTFGKRINSVLKARYEQKKMQSNHTACSWQQTPQSILNDLLSWFKELAVSWMYKLKSAKYWQGAYNIKNRLQSLVRMTQKRINKCGPHFSLTAFLGQECQILRNNYSSSRFVNPEKECCVNNLCTRGFNFVPSVEILTFDICNY